MTMVSSIRPSSWWLFIFFFLWCNLCPYKVISHFYIAHTYYATSVHINKMAAFPVYADFSRKVNHPFYLQTGYRKCGKKLTIIFLKL